MSVLSRAVAYWKAVDYSGSGDLLDGTGNGHDAQLGSTGGADTNDPRFYDYTGTQHMWIPGGNNNLATIPDAAYLTPTASVEVFLRAGLNWTGRNTGRIASHSSGDLLGWEIYTRDQTIQVRIGKGTGEGYIEQVSDNHGLSDFDVVWMRILITLNDGGNTTTAYWYSAEAESHPNDVSSWTAFGTDTDAVAGAIGNPTETLGIGGKIETGNEHEGSIYRCVIKIDGTIQVDADFTDTAVVAEPFVTFTEKSANAAIVTINRGGGPRTSMVDRKMFLLGYDDYLEVDDHADLDFALADDFTVIFLGRSYDITPSDSHHVLIAKQDGITTAAGYSMRIDGGGGGTINVVVADGTNSGEDSVSAGFADGTPFNAALVRTTGDDDIEAFLDGSGSGSPTGDPNTDPSANAFPLRIGATSNAANFRYDGEFFGAAIFAEALSAADITTAGNELLGAGVPLLHLMHTEGLRVGVR